MSNADLIPFPPKLPSADPRIGEIVNYYLQIEVADRVKRARDRRAWEERHRLLLRFEQALGALKLSECTKAHLRSWIDTNPKLKSDWTRGRYCAAVQRCFNWAMNDYELIGRNPFKGVRYRKGKRGRPLTEDEFERLLALSKETAFEPILRFCRLTGARPGELRGARWEDLRLDEAAGCAWIQLAEHKTSDRDDAKPRILALPRAALDLLIALKAAGGFLPGLEPEQIFLNSRGRAWKRHSLCQFMRRLRLRARLPADAKLYGCRHAFATGAVEAGIALKDLAELLGHASTRMTEHYVHIAGKHQRQCSLADQATAAVGRIAQDQAGPTIAGLGGQ